MRNARVVVATVVAAAVAGFVFSATSRNVQGQAGPQQAPRSIDSLAEPGQSLQVTDVSQESGFVTFAASRGTGLLLPVEADAPAEERALAFLDAYGGPFGLRGRGQAQLLREPTRDELGLDHVRLQQMHQGLPVRGGELIVHLRGNRAMAANGMVFDRLPADVRPQYPAGAAEIEARAVVERAREDLSLGMRLSAPRLEIFSGRLFGKGDLPARTAWFFEAVGPTLREFIWVDAATGGVLLNFSQLAHAKNRTTYNSNNTAALPGTLARSEGQGPTGNAEVDSAHDLAGVTYDYFFSTHGRDSYDGLGGALISTVNHCPTSAACPYANAFWSGTQMVYGAGYARSDDVVAHELTHAVTEKSAGLLYYYQSGALNESFSDIFGETVDLLSATGGGNDTAGVRWQMGEDLPIGAIRNMMNPTLFWDPGKMSDPQFYCVTNAWANQSLDYGGVHHNSGVPNHAYALMVDGGTYNGMTVTGIGLDKAAKIQYRTLTTYLTSGARFVDNLNGVLQSCFDLIGLHGITAADCGEVLEAMLAVQMDFTWNCPGAVAAPAMCSAGQPSPVFSDHLESGFGNWAISSSSAVNWGPSSFFASSGTTSMYGPDASSTSIHNVQKTTPVVVPANAFLYFKHAFEFDHVGNLSYDGGVMEFSTNAGSSWISAQPLINAGQNYTDGLELGTPLPSGTQAFTRSSFGYTATRLNLASLAGMSLTFRFRVATNATVGSLGWLIDDVSIYTCGAGVGPVITSNPVNQTIAPGGDATFTVAATGIPGPEYTWYVSANGGVTWAPVNDAPPYSGARTPTLRIDDAPVGLNGRRYKALVRNNHGEQETTSALLTVGATYTLSISKAGAGTGTVTSSPAGINCGSSCSASFNSGQVVMLTATPSAGSLFAGWSGDADCSDGSVTMSAARSCTATFTVQTYLLSVSKAGTGTGTVTSSPAGINCGSSCSASFNSGQVVMLTATPSAGSTFAGWSGDADCSDGSVTMSAARSCTATFTGQTYLLSVSKAGTGTGTVTSSPAGINCGSSCSASFNTGQVVTLTATPLAGSTFVSWTGDADCSDGTVTMTGPRSCTATFTAQTPVTVTPASLRFAALKAGAAGPVTNVTPPQTVTVSFPGLPDVWSASSPQSWLQVTNGAGNGDGQFTVAIVNPGNVIGGNTTLGGVVSVVIASDPTVSVSVPVTLTVDQTGASTTAAFGQVDTPAQNAPNQVGAIGVTGWALDDVAVMSVKIYRTCVAFDNPASCQSVLGQNVVFVGDAAFLAGARPDVEAAFPAYPFNYRAGWGMQILTNMLPNLPAAQLYGGQGTIALYAVATDVEGHSTLLGRTSADSTPTTVTLNNSAIAKPFGTADTPLLGATVSGTLPAFLWALTPDTDTVAGNGDIQINPAGTTMVLFVDGVATAPVAFNQCRGTVGNPPPSGVYCNDDVANVFGNTIPQAPLTPRMSNPSRFRNLDAGRGAIGVNVINTTLLANGLHTVAWSVTDSAGRVEGIGSRFFTVLNGGGSLAERIVTLVSVLTAPAVARGQAASLDGVRVSRRPVSVRTGYDLQTPMTALAPDSDGVRHVTLAPLGRLEIGLANAATGGYLDANGELRDLPPGSHLDRATGVFTWMPPVMYIGTYRLVFLIDGERVVVSVRLGKR